MFKLLGVLLAIACLVSAKPLDQLFDDADPTQIYAVLVSGVPSDEKWDLNYCVEAEVARTYHELIDRGVPADNIILFLNGGFANDEKQNPYPGTLYTDLERSRNYAEGLRVDYSGDEVNAKNFLAVIQGEKENIVGGSGRVLKSTENNRVFISHEGHGNSGYLALNHDKLFTEALHDALNKMQEKNLFNKLVYYVMACKSGSMFNEQLSGNGSTYAFTAADPVGSAYPKDILEVDVGGKHFLIYINTEFGDAWLDNAENKNTQEETLEEQHDFVLQNVFKSYPQRYGNLEIGKEAVANFEGVNALAKPAKKQKFNPKQDYDEERIPIDPIASYLILKQKLKRSKNFAEQEELKKQLKKMEAERDQIKLKVNSIVKELTGKSSFSDFEQFHKPPQQIKQLSCHTSVMRAFFDTCAEIKKSPFVGEFIAPIVNLCEQKYPADNIVEHIKKQCA